MIVGTLQDGLELHILTSKVLKCNNIVHNGLTLHYNPRNRVYNYIVKSLSKDYIKMDEKWFRYEINQLLSYIERQDDPEYSKKKSYLCSVPYIIDLNDYINSIELQLAVDMLLSESDYQTSSDGIYLVTEVIKSKIVIEFWYRKIRKEIFLW